MDIGSLLRTYPRTRPVLSKAEQDIYRDEYLISRKAFTKVTRLARRFEAWMHQRVAETGQGATLEVGAGTLNHLEYETNLLGSHPYDIVEPQKYLYEGSEHRGFLRNVYVDIRQADTSAGYGRIISIAVMEHVCDLPALIARTGLLLEDGGVLCNAIPSEGGLLWGLSWRVTTGLSYRLRTGFSYRNLMRHEHVNTAHEVQGIMRHFFSKVSIQRFPLPMHHMSLFCVLRAQGPQKQLCREYLLMSEK